MTVRLCALEWSDWIISFSAWFSPYLPCSGWPNRGIPHPLSPPIYLSLIFQTLLICPGHLSEKFLTFKSFMLWIVHTDVSSLLVCLVTSRTRVVCACVCVCVCVRARVRVRLRVCILFLHFILNSLKQVTWISDCSPTNTLKAQREPHIFWTS